MTIDLPWEARQALLNLELLMDDDGLGHDDRDDEPEYLTHRRRMLAAAAHELPRLIEEARAACQEIRKRATPVVDTYNPRLTVLAECVGFTPEEVHTSGHGTAPRVVRKWRMDAGRDPETGRPMAGQEGTAKERVLALRAELKSVRVIAMTLRIPKSTVFDLIRDEEAAA